MSQCKVRQFIKDFNGFANRLHWGKKYYCFICIDNKTFVLLAIAQTFYYIITIHLPCKLINPAYYLKGEIICCALVGYFISSGYKSDFNTMNIHKYHLNLWLYVPENRLSLTPYRDGGKADRRTAVSLFCDVQLNWAFNLFFNFY
jgi:hypothetical protein